MNCEPESGLRTTASLQAMANKGLLGDLKGQTVQELQKSVRQLHIRRFWGIRKIARFYNLKEWVVEDLLISRLYDEIAEAKALALAANVRADRAERITRIAMGKAQSNFGQADANLGEVAFA